MLTPEQLVGYLVSAMIMWSPWHQHETRPETRARYESIAYDAATVALEDAGRDVPWAKLVVSRGAFTDVPVAKTALLMLAISSYESGGFRPDVDSIEATGDCWLAFARATQAARCRCFEHGVNEHVCVFLSAIPRP